MSVTRAIEQALERANQPFAEHTARLVKDAIDEYLRTHPTALLLLCCEQGLLVESERGFEIVANPVLDLAERSEHEL